MIFQAPELCCLPFLTSSISLIYFSLSAAGNTMQQTSFSLFSLTRGRISFSTFFVHCKNDIFWFSYSKLPKGSLSTSISQYETHPLNKVRQWHEIFLLSEVDPEVRISLQNFHSSDMINALYLPSSTKASKSSLLIAE